MQAAQTPRDGGDKESCVWGRWIESGGDFQYNLASVLRLWCSVQHWTRRRLTQVGKGSGKETSWLVGAYIVQCPWLMSLDLHACETSQRFFLQVYGKVLLHAPNNRFGSDCSHNHLLGSLPLPFAAFPYTASSEKLAGAWEQGYIDDTVVS